jgi:hypothetical protein
LSQPSENLVRFSSDAGASYSYNPSRTLGRPGGFGFVFEGVDTEGNQIAVKRVRIAGATTERRRIDGAFAEREVQVAQRLGKSAGSHVIPLLDVAHGEDELLLVMPRAETGLDHYIEQNGPMPSAEVIEVLKQIALGMQELAVESVVHRDIKPSNILYLNGKWCIADFGISRIASDATATATWAGTGTLEYRAPELWRGDPERVLSDLYAVGCVAYEMLASHPAFPGPEYREQHAVSMPTFPDGVDPVLHTVILRLLDKEPANRPPDARGVTEMLSRSEALTDGQLALQRMQYRKVQRESEATQRLALANQHRERQGEAMEAAKRLWGEVVEAAKTAVPGASNEGYALTVGDSQIRMDAAGAPSQAAPLVFVGELEVIADKPNDSPQIFPANMVCTWEDGVPRWYIVRFKPNDGARLSGVRKPRDEVADKWPDFEDENLVVTMKDYAKQDLILDIFGEAVEAALEGTGESPTVQ